MNIYSCLWEVLLLPSLSPQTQHDWPPLLFFNLFHITQTHRQGMFYYNDFLLTLHIVFNISVHFYFSTSEFIRFIVLHRCCLFIYFYFSLRYDGHTALYKFKVYQIAFLFIPPAGFLLSFSIFVCGPIIVPEAQPSVCFSLTFSLFLTPFPLPQAVGPEILWLSLHSISHGPHPESPSQTGPCSPCPSGSINVSAFKFFPSSSSFSLQPAHPPKNRSGTILSS